MTAEPDARSPAPALDASAPNAAPPDGQETAPRSKRWIVEAFGREWPKSTRPERAFWAFLMVCCFATIGLAAFALSPDQRGIGTHEQLGLPACGFVTMAGGPCPSCGFTTTFTLAAHLRPIDALVNQPFGFLVFALTFLGMFGLPVVVVKNISLFALTDRWPWIRIGLALLGGWLVSWAYKWHMQVGFFQG